MKLASRVYVIMIATLFLSSCKKETDQTPAVETAMAVFASWLQNDPPSTANVSERVRLYINSQPSYFLDQQLRSSTIMEKLPPAHIGIGVVQPLQIKN